MISGAVIAIDPFGVALVVTGFHMAFRERLLRAFWRRRRGAKRVDDPAKIGQSLSDGEDPVRYALLISAIMIMVFGFVLAMMFTLIRLG